MRVYLVLFNSHSQSFHVNFNSLLNSSFETYQIVPYSYKFKLKLVEILNNYHLNQPQNRIFYANNYRNFSLNLLIFIMTPLFLYFEELVKLVLMFFVFEHELYEFTSNFIVLLSIPDSQHGGKYKKINLPL